MQSRDNFSSGKTNDPSLEAPKGNRGVTPLPSIISRSRITDMALVVLLSIFHATCLLIAALFTRAAFASLHENATPSFFILGMLVLCGLGIALCQLFITIKAETLGQSFAKSLRSALYSQFSGMSLNDLKQKRIGGLSLRFVGDLSAARNWAGSGITHLIASIIILPASVFALYWISPVLALAGGGPVIVATVLMVVTAIRLQSLHRSLRSKRASISIRMMERLAMSSELDLAGRTKKELEDLDAASEMLKQDAVARRGRHGLLRTLLQIGTAAGGVSVLATSGVYKFAAADAAAALAILSILILPLRNCADIWDRFCAWQIARQKLLVVFSQKSRHRIAASKGKAVSVELRQVIFRNHIFNACINAGEVAFINGKQGSGKTSFLSLVAGLDRPDKGEIVYGEEPGVFPKIVYISDIPLAIKGSIRRALTIGLEKRPGSRLIRKTAEKFGFSEVLERMGGLRGSIGEGGRNLSAGEVLRFELTRAVLAKPDLIVIDSSHLNADEKRDILIQTLREETCATILIAGKRPAETDQNNRELLTDSVNIELGAANTGNRENTARAA